MSNALVFQPGLVGLSTNATRISELKVPAQLSAMRANTPEGTQPIRTAGLWHGIEDWVLAHLPDGRTAAYNFAEVELPRPPTLEREVQGPPPKAPPLKVEPRVAGEKALITINEHLVCPPELLKYRQNLPPGVKSGTTRGACPGQPRWLYVEFSNGRLGACHFTELAFS